MAVTGCEINAIGACQGEAAVLVKQGELPMQENAAKRPRYSISVSGRTYKRLRAAVSSGSLARFVDKLIVRALDDPEMLARVIFRCRIDVNAARLASEHRAGLRAHRFPPKEHVND